LGDQNSTGAKLRDDFVVFLVKIVTSSKLRPENCYLVATRSEYPSCSTSLQTRKWIAFEKTCETKKTKLEAMENQNT